MRAETKHLIGMVVCLAGFFLFLVVIVYVFAGVWNNEVQFETTFSGWFMVVLGAVIWETALMIGAIFEYDDYRKEKRTSQKVEQT